MIQLVAVGATFVFAVVATFVIVKVVDLVLGLRVSATDEEIGIDLAVHGEVAYQPSIGTGPAPGPSADPATGCPPSPSDGSQSQGQRWVPGAGPGPSTGW